MEQRLPGLSDRVAAATVVYNLYAIAPAMSDESPGGKGWGMERPSVQWDVFRRAGKDGKGGKADTYLVRMLYNEMETAFKAGCHPIAKNSAFYDLDELERCFGRTNSAS